MNEETRRLIEQAQQPKDRKRSVREITHSCLKEHEDCENFGVEIEGDLFLLNFDFDTMCWTLYNGSSKVVAFANGENQAEEDGAEMMQAYFDSNNWSSNDSFSIWNLEDLEIKFAIQVGIPK